MDLKLEMNRLDKRIGIYGKGDLLCKIMPLISRVLDCKGIYDDDIESLGLSHGDRKHFEKYVVKHNQYVLQLINNRVAIITRQSAVDDIITREATEGLMSGLQNIKKV